MDVDPLITALHTQGLLLGDAAERAGLATDVPTCPGWTTRELLLHIGHVHRWAAETVGERRPTRPVLYWPDDPNADEPADDDLLDWYRAGHAHLVHTLRAAPADLDCWSFLPAPSPLAFWTRRQAHETTMHRADADRATGPGTSAPIDAGFAEDGVDELLVGWVPGSRKLRAETERTLHVHATDVAAHWLVRISQDRPKAERLTAPPEAADLCVSGPAEHLYLALWHRQPWDGLTVTGDDVERIWSDGVQI